MKTIIIYNATWTGNEFWLGEYEHGPFRSIAAAEEYAAAHGLEIDPDSYDMDLMSADRENREEFNLN